MYFINESTSSAVAFPLLTIKPACFLETSAPPIENPFNPHLSINFAVSSIPLDILFILFSDFESFS